MQDGTASLIVDEPGLTILREDYPDGRVLIKGEADFSRVSLERVRQVALEQGLIISYVEQPFIGEDIGWRRLTFVRREVSNGAVYREATG